LQRLAKRVESTSTLSKNFLISIFRIGAHSPRRF
jgi:hypothetical protein